MRRFWFVCVVASLWCAPGLVWAQDGEEEKKEEAAAESEIETPPKSGLRIDSSLVFRQRPIALSLIADVGYRHSLSDDDENALWKGTHIEGGAYLGFSPATLRAGGYVNWLPIALLNIRAQIQYQSYFGNLGLAFTPPNADQTGEDPSWNLTDLDDSVSGGLGTSTQGLLAQFVATPRIRVGNVLATAETRLHYSILDVDTPVHDIAVDLLVDPTDLYLAFRPWLGYMFYQDPANGYLLAAVRYEQLNAFGSTQAGRRAVGGLVVWGLPRKWLGSGRYSVTVLGNQILQDPTDRVGLTAVTVRLRGEFGAK